MSEYKIGDVIKSGYGSYKVTEIMKGGMGIVYVVSDLEKDQPRVLKTYQEKYKWKERTLQRFVREAKIWIEISRLLEDPFRDPFVVRAFGVHTINSRPYLELEFIPHGSLANLMQYGLSLPVILDLSAQFCKGIYSLNTKFKNFVHQDIKPENLLLKKLLGELLILKISDFGMAEVKNELLKESGVDSAIGGTRLYMSPEQFAESKMLDTRTDIFSFGVVLLEMLTIGKAHGTRQWTEAMLQFQKDIFNSAMNSKKLLELNPRLPKGLDAVLIKCIDKNPDKRYEGFDLLESDIQEIIKQEGFDNWEKYDTPYSGNRITIDMDYAQTNEDPREAQLKQAFSYVTVGEIDMAMSIFNELLRLDPRDPVVLANKGRLLSQYLGKTHEGIKVLDQSLSIDPTNEYTWTYKGMACASIGDFKGADKCYDKAVSINPRFNEAWRNKGALYSNTGKLREALSCFKKAEEIEEEDDLLHQCKGITYEKLRDFHKAAASYKRAFELNANDIASLVNYGNCLMLVKDYEESEKILLSAIQIDENYAFAWLILGTCLYNQKRYKDALLCFERVQMLSPEMIVQYNVTNLIHNCLLACKTTA